MHINNEHAVGGLNDLWSYEMNTKIWTWISGGSVRNQAAVYGILGRSAPSNRPGARSRHTMAIETSSNTIFVFGGYGYDATSPGNWIETVRNISYIT